MGLGAAAFIGQLAAATGLARKAVLAILQQIQLAGYARRVPSGKSEDERFELIDHVRRWIETIRGPLPRQGHSYLIVTGRKICPSSLDFSVKHG